LLNEAVNKILEKNSYWRKITFNLVKKKTWEQTIIEAEAELENDIFFIL
jgi:hypothetical protein